MSLPCGTRSYNYSQDTAIVRTKTQWALLLGLLVVLFTLPLYLRTSWLSVVNLIGINLIAVSGLNILLGYCGQLSIGHAGFMAIGAYTSAILTGTFHVPFPFAFLLSGLSAGLVGVVFGIPSLRVKGFYLAITTIAAQMIILWVINHWTNVTGGFNGLSVPYATFGGFTFRTESSQFFLIMGVTVATIFLTKNIARNKLGRAFVAIRDNDLAAQVMGVNLFQYKLLAFFIGCFFAGIAGSLYAHWAVSISAEAFTFMDSVLFIGMIIIGGLGTTVGPIFGVVFLSLLDEIVTRMSPALQNAIPQLPSGFTTGLAPMIFGLVIILFLILEPRGIAHRWQLFKSAYRLWPFSY
jgi:branched-chain amino acid transport system permease protein